MMDDKFALVEFQGAQLLTIFDGDTIRVAVKHVCEALGIDWRSQHAKISGDAVLSKGMVLSTIPSERGPQQTITLPIDLMHGWLFKLNPERVAAEARPQVIAFQQECYQVLHDYWVKGSAVNPRSTAQIEHNDRTARRRELPGLLDRYEAETNPEKRRVLYALIVRACESEGITPPAPDAIGYDAPQVTDMLRQFWDHVAQVEADGTLINYHRNPMKLAFRRKQLEQAFKKSGIDFPIGNALMDALRFSKSPRFESVGRVSTMKDGRKTVYAWTFHRGPSPVAEPT